MPDLICKEGVLRKGAPCWYLEREKGDRVFLLGNLDAVREADTVIACGMMADAPVCGGSALVVSWIGTKSQGGVALPQVVTRDVEVTATLSSRDYSPVFKLEGKKLPLRAKGNRWHGSFDAVTVQGTLDVTFMSDGWQDQRFTVSVTATDPANAKKKWAGEFVAIVKKDQVLISDSLDVGAASSPPPIVASAPTNRGKGL